MFEIIGMLIFIFAVFMFLFIVIGSIAAAIDVITDGAISKMEGRGKNANKKR